MRLRMDPFLQKKYRVGAGYMADVHRTYNHEIPRQSFERALQHREHERAQIDALVAENAHLRELNARKRKDDMTLLDAQLTRLWQNISKSPVTNGTPTDRGDDGTECGRLPPAQEPDDGPPGGVPLRVQPQELPADVPDPGGPSAEHSDAGRPISDDGVSEQPTGGRVPTE